MAAVNIQQIGDFLRQTRATELKKGSWVSLSSDLPDYPFYSTLVQKTTRRSSDRYEWTATFGTPNDTHYSAVNDPLQISIPEISKRLGVRLSKVRKAIGYARDEEELQGGDEETLVDIILQRKAEQLDQPLLSFLEHELAGNGGSSSAPRQQILGLDYWLPAKTTATDLELNGGSDPVGFANGAADLRVADLERWAHAVCGFTKVSDDDLLDKLHEFFIRANYWVPEGVRQLDSAVPSRCVLCQHPVYLTWARLQTKSNDDLRDDVGMWRNSINFMSVPVKWWPAISTPGAKNTPVGSGRLYALDLNSIELITHSAFNFDLETGNDPNVPGTVKLWREGYTQLVVKNREKQLVAYTTAPDLIVS